MSEAISIHALRVEGDYQRERRNYITLISIHALRVEGDTVGCEIQGFLPQISIHALRVEGDWIGDTYKAYMAIFLSTPSGWRATSEFHPYTPAV